MTELEEKKKEFNSRLHEIENKYKHLFSHGVSIKTYVELKLLEQGGFALEWHGEQLPGVTTEVHALYHELF